MLLHSAAPDFAVDNGVQTHFDNVSPALLLAATQEKAPVVTKLKAHDGVQLPPTMVPWQLLNAPLVMLGGLVEQGTALQTGTEAVAIQVLLSRAPLQVYEPRKDREVMRRRGRKRERRDREEIDREVMKSIQESATVEKAQQQFEYDAPVSA